IGTTDPIGRASFVSVVRGEIARTESGIHVGSTRDELVQALGAPIVELDRARDPHVIVPGHLRELRAVLDDHDRVVGLVIAAPDAGKEPPKDECVRPAPDPEEPGHAPRTCFGACMTAAGEVVTVEGDEITIRIAENAKPIPASVPGLVFAAPVRNPD